MSDGGKFTRHSWTANKNKYGNVKVEHAGRSFASKGEARLFDYLCLLEKAGECRDIKQQVSVKMTKAKIEYRPDYSAVNTSTGEVEYFEYKGFPTDVWRIKRRLWMNYGPGKLHIWVGNPRDITLSETIIPKDNEEC